MKRLNKDVALVVLSGGQDSTTCLFWAKQRYKTVHAITFGYGQKHHREIDAAKKVAGLAGVSTHEVLYLNAQGLDRKEISNLWFPHTQVLKGTSPLTNPQEKLEQYKNWQSLPGGLEKTFVPGRNALFLTLAANRAYCLDALSIVTGICEEDSGGYPDCTEWFRENMETSLRAAMDADFDIEAPLMNLSKAQTVVLAEHLGPECWATLAHTHTSYDGAYPPTGNDHATLLRAKGFEQANRADPLVVRAHNEGLMALPNTHNYDSVRPHDDEHQG